MEHLDGQVLSARVMDGDAPIDAAGDEQVPRGGVGQFDQGAVELGELLGHAGALDIEETLGAGLEAAGEQGEGGVGGDREGLVHGGGELVDLVLGGDVPEADGAVTGDGEDVALGQVVVHLDNGIGM